MTVEVEEMMMEVRFLSARRADMLPCCVWLIGGIPERVAGYEAFLKHLTSTSTLFRCVLMQRNRRVAVVGRCML